jgi:alpha-galactosidase
MKRSLHLLCFSVAAFLVAGTAAGQERVSPGTTTFNVRQWVEMNFAKNVIPPFSFNLGKKNSNDFIINWEYSAATRTSNDPNVEELVYTYRDKQSGLTVKCLVSCFKDFPAVEWVLTFANSSNRNSPILSQARVIDHTFVSDQKGIFALHHANGSNAQRTDFQPLTDVLQTGKNIYMTPAGGRSSDNTGFPFFNVEMPAQRGVMVAVGWSGKWYANVVKTDEKSLHLVSGMEKMQTLLLPGEEIRTPKICLLFWQGEDRMIGHNQFRQFVLVHHTRKINAKHVELPFSTFLAREGPPPCNEHTCATESFSVAIIYRHQQFNIVPEVFWLDAGWYFCNGSWPQVGNWTPNPENFPNGLKPVSDAAHQVGAKFLLWFEPERVTAGTLFANKNPDWLLKIPGNGNALFNLGNEQARIWLTDYIANFIKKEGIDYYRQDFNFDPKPYWDAHDKPERIGISEIRHIEGLYAFWDSLLVRFPDLLIDNCASGGRRIDLETISKSSPLWRTDYQYGEPNGSQCHSYGLNFYLPLHGTGNFTISPYHFRSNMSASMVIHWDINSKEHSQAELARYFQDFKRLRPYYYGDYYPLTGAENMTRDNVWLAYQLNRPSENDGVVLAFRRQDCQTAAISVKLRGLEDTAMYEVFYEDYEIKVKMSGAELMRGVSIAIPTRPGSLLISYMKLGN